MDVCGYSSTTGWPTLNDVFETECAVAREALALAPAAEVLSMGTFGVHVARRHCARAARLVAVLEEEFK